MFFFYQILVTFLLLLAPLIIILRIFKGKEDKKRYIEKFSIPTQKRVLGNLIWFHGASVGEIMSIVPLLKIYEKDKSINQILVTSSTLSSSKIIKKALRQSKKVLPDKSRFSTVLKASKLMFLRNAKKNIKPI